MTDGGYTAIAQQLGLQRETLRRWVLEAEGMDPYRPGQPKVLTARDEETRMAKLERENRELRRANEILKTAAGFMQSRGLCRTDGGGGRDSGRDCLAERAGRAGSA